MTITFNNGEELVVRTEAGNLVTFKITQIIGEVLYLREIQTGTCFRRRQSDFGENSNASWNYRTEDNQ